MFFFSSRRRHTRCSRDWSSDVCSSDLGGDLGYSFGRFSELRVGYEVGSLNTKLRLGTPEIPAVEGRVGQSHLHYLLDHTDDPVIPRRGFSAESNFRWFDQSPGDRKSTRLNSSHGYISYAVFCL